MYVDQPGEYDENNMRRTDRVSRWGPASQALLDHPNALPYTVELLGPKVRFDHDYCIFMQKGGKAGRLHGGQTMQGGVPGDHWYKYHDGMIRNGLTVFTYCLTHADSGDGGFGCIPGSHNSNFTVDIPAEVRCHERSAHYVCQVAVKAGDLIIVTEALVHGTMEWTAAIQVQSGALVAGKHLLRRGRLPRRYRETKAHVGVAVGG